MKRPVLIWITFITCLAVVLSTLAWVSKRVIDVERSEVEARARADYEEAVRLAQWRMSGALSPLVHRESARPYFAYQPFYAPDQAYTKMFASIDQANREVLLPSRLLVVELAEVRLHFQIAPDGNLTSPQIPEGNMRDLAESRSYTTGERISSAQRKLAALGAKIRSVGTGNGGSLALANRLPAPAPLPEPQTVEKQPVQCMPARNILPERVVEDLNAKPDPFLTQLDQDGNEVERWSNTPQIEGPLLQSDSQQRQTQERQTRGNWRQQTLRNSQEAEVRNFQSEQILAVNNDANYMFDNGWSKPPYSEIAEGLMTGVWVDGELLFARRVRVGQDEYVQGCWLDWPLVKKSLLGTCHDLFPEANLVPTTGLSDDRRVSFLPVDIMPGPAPVLPVEEMTSLEWFLLVAWSSGLLAAAAVAVLLVGALSLSERRRRFVSAVTHELRTPLTTFRMYTEMLSSGMVKGKEKEAEYLQRLHLEAERLGHLVENVLTYARLEAGRGRGAMETHSPSDVFEQVRCRLEERCEQAGVELAVRVDAELPSVRTDSGALERILFNLVDNACKYGRGNPPRIDVEARAVNGRVAVQVSDNGPGVHPDKVKSLFRAFSKTAGATTSESPGVGLGLSLSRRLARDMGGDLSLDMDYGDGARFVLWLPVV